MPTAVILFAVLVAPVGAYQQYQSQIPNGANVPGAPGVGHVATGGGGQRNTFGKSQGIRAGAENNGWPRPLWLRAGQAFVMAGYRWTSELCKADSDGDGLSNGQAFRKEWWCGRWRHFDFAVRCRNWVIRAARGGLARHRSAPLAYPIPVRHVPSAWYGVIGRLRSWTYRLSVVAARCMTGVPCTSVLCGRRCDIAKRRHGLVRLRRHARDDDAVGHPDADVDRHAVRIAEHLVCKSARWY